MVPFFGAESRLTLDTTSSAPVGTTDHLVAVAYDDRPYTQFIASASGTTDIITDAGVGVTVGVDYFGVVNHNLFTIGSTITFAHSPDGATYTTISTFSPADDLIILRWFARVTDRFFRLRITGGSAAVQIGETRWGRAVTMPYGVEIGFDPQQEKIDAKVNLSQTGNFIGAVSVFITRNLTVSLKLIPDAFIRGTNPDQFGWLMTNYVEKIKPFFFNWTTDSTYEKDGFFGIVDPSTIVKRTISTPLASGFRDIQFNLLGPKL